jgi:hypothetical protein
MARSPSPFVARAGSAISQPRQRRTAAAVAMLLVLAIAPLALAQTDTSPTPAAAPAKHKKKKAKPAASASASASATEDATPPPAPAPTPEPPAPEPSASASASAAPAVSAAASLPDTPSFEVDNTNTTEDPNKRYIFVGLRYRGTIVPQFLESLFVNEGATIYSNTIGAEIDIRKGGQSMIPWIQYTDYNTGDMLFLQKGQDPNDAAFYSVVNSSLKSIYVGIDELWSTPIANHLDFEYGFGVGVGFIFGGLQNDWVYQSANGPFTASNGLRLAECPSQNGQRGCQTADHQNATVAKVGGYAEPNWFNGGAVPVFLPHIAIPQLSLRYKPITQLETRLSIGFSLTGFWFGLSADYGLEHADEASSAATHKSSFGPTVRDTL